MYDFNALAMAALVISIASSLTYVAYFQLRAVSLSRRLSKTTATAALAVAAWAGGVSLIFCIALLLAAVGDYFKSYRSERSLAIAIIASGGMQVLVCIWFAAVLWRGIDAPMVAILGVFGIAGGFFVMILPHFGRRVILLLPYFVTSLALLTLGLGASPDRPYLMTGIALYLVSLILLGFELILFADRYKFLLIVGPVIWVLYYAGLVLMMIGGI